MDTQPTLLKETAQIVSSHVANNPMSPEQVTVLIREVYSTLINLGQAGNNPSIGHNADAASESLPPPAVPIRKSVTPDYIVCLEDGKQFKMLRRHLMSAYNMSPEQYRRKWNLPADYPMVAPNYAQLRSGLAKDIGLGTHRARTNRSPTREAEAPAARSGPSIKRIPEGVSGRRATRRVAA